MSEKGNSKNSIEQIKEQTHLTEPINLQTANAVNVQPMNIQNSMYPQPPQQTLYQKSYFNGYVQQPQQQQKMFYPAVDTSNVAPTVPALIVGKTEKAVAKSKPCVSTPTNLCPTSPLNLFMKPSKAGHSHSKQLHHNNGALETLGNTTVAEVEQMTKQPAGDENQNNKKLGAAITNQIKLPMQAIQAEAEKSPTHSSHGGKYLFCNNKIAQVIIKLFV